MTWLSTYQLLENTHLLLFGISYIQLSTLDECGEIRNSLKFRAAAKLRSMRKTPSLGRRWISLDVNVMEAAGIELVEQA